jgi:hypothetical protein
MEKGEHPRSVAECLNAELGGLVICSGSSHDRRWMGELFAEAAIEAWFGMADITAAFEGPEIVEMAYQAAL